LAAVEKVRIWRPSPEDRVLLMAGRTTGYTVEPRGEFVFGVVQDAPMRSTRGRERRLIEPGRLVAWDPSRRHSGRAVDGRPWTSRLMVVEVGDLTGLATDEDDPLTEVAFTDPVLDDGPLAARFVRVHRALQEPTTRLERDGLLSGWLRMLLERTGTPPRRRRAGDEQALRRAADYLRDRPAHNVGLDELAAVAGVGKFRLVRLFRERTGLPPHALQIAHRIRLARRLLEAGEPIAEVATATGFADQSHLYRHFTRSLGMTPGEYQRRL
jgi:AraC-like DNA-binding protein